MEDVHLHLKRYGLKEQPFAPTADPAYFYATQEHKSCLYRLWSSIDERHGIAVVLGNYGTGKTTLLRKLMTGMAADPEKYNTAIIGSPIPSWTSFSLLEAIITQFGLEPEARSFASYMDALNKYLIANRNRVNTLIIDDAQNLNKRGQLELLRLAQNLETPQHKLLNLVLFAQLEWARVLEAAPNFQQRINLTYTLSPLKRADISEFIRFRLAHAGAAPADTAIFDEDAISLIYVYSEGNPRVVVTMCRNALLFASQIKKTVIDRDIVAHTIEKTTLPSAAKLAAAKGMIGGAPLPRAAVPIVQPKNEIEEHNRLAQAPADTILPATTPRSNSDKAKQMLLNASRNKQQ